MDIERLGSEDDEVSEVIAFTMFTTFLLPLWSLSFATEGIGREREDRNLLWLQTELKKPKARRFQGRNAAPPLNTK